MTEEKTGEMIAQADLDQKVVSTSIQDDGRELIPTGLSGATLDRYLHRFETGSALVDGSNVSTYFAVPENDPDKNRIVFFECKIKRMSNINTIDETFRCRFHIYLTWLATKDESEKYKDCKENNIKYIPDWIPDVKWLNAVEIYDIKQWEQGRYKVIEAWKHQAMDENTWDIKPDLIGFEPWYGNWNRVKIDYDVKFAEEFELPGFPFDCQDLSLHLQMDYPANKADLLPFPRTKCFLLYTADFRTSEWKFENILCEFIYSKEKDSKRRIKYPKIEIHIKASRRWIVHVGQIIVTFCMFTLGLITFVQDLDNDEAIGNRLGYSITLMLADVATVQLVFSNTQYIGYWTILDYYIYSCFTFLYLIIIWSGFAIALIDPEDVNTIDAYVFYVFAAVCFLLHCYFLYQAYSRYKNEQTKLTMTSDELEDFFAGTVAFDDQDSIAVMGNLQNLNTNGYHENNQHNFFARGETAKYYNS